MANLTHKETGVLCRMHEVRVIGGKRARGAAALLRSVPFPRGLQRGASYEASGLRPTATWNWKAV
jgi:hypothetical protein